jgi:hypothetical protein
MRKRTRHGLGKRRQPPNEIRMVCNANMYRDSNL